MASMAATQTATGQGRGAAKPLFAEGIDSAEVRAHRERVRELIADEIVPLFASAEASRRFPREAAAAIGAAGLYRDRWSGEHGDAGRALILAEELGRALVGGIGVGLMLQSEAVAPILRRFGRSPEALDWLGAVLDGEAVGCVAASELRGGSDLAAIETTARPDGDGWRIEGQKAYSSPAGAADFCLVLCRLEGDPSFLGSKLALALVERSQFQARLLQTSGCRSLQTSRLRIDARVPSELLLAPQGLGLHAANWGLTYERFAAAALALGGCDTVVGLTATHLRRRSQFGAPLFEHQALRMRLAALAGDLMLARQGLYAMAAGWGKPDGRLMRDAAAAKGSAAMLSERLLSECAHMFGGAGYLEDETPFPRLLRDLRVARLGGGTNEIMWELFAQGLESDDAAYDRLISIERSE